MKVFFIFLMLGPLYCLKLSAQSGNSVTQGKGVNTEFNKGNGGIGTSVYLFDLDFGDRVIPVTLNYSSSGLRYDDIHGKFGAGWSFSLDHSWNRTVRGKLDEYSILPNMDSIEALVEAKSLADKDEELLNFAVKDFINPVALGTRKEYPQYTNNLKNWDSEYDIFTFSNFSGAGKFILLNREREILDTRNLQFFDSPALKWKIENDFHPLVPFYLYDDAGIKYEYADLGFTTMPDGGSAVTSQHLNTAIHPNGDSIRMEYEYINKGSVSADRYLSIIEGHEGNTGLPSILTRIDEINPGNISGGVSKDLLTVETKTLKISIYYTDIDNKRLISSIRVATRQRNPRTIRHITFRYSSLGGRFILLKNITVNNGMQSADSDKKYNFVYFNESTTQFFDRDIFGYAYLNYSNSNYTNSNISAFPNQINYLPVYSNYSPTWGSVSLSTIKPNLKVSDKLTINESKTGLLKSIFEEHAGLLTTFDYDLNQLWSSVRNAYYYAGFRLKETYQQARYLTTKVNHRRFYYGNIPNQETMNVNGNSNLVGSGRIINDYFGNKQVEHNYINQKGLVIKIPTSSGTTWALLNKYEIATNYTSAGSFLDLFSNNIYFDRIQEVLFNGSTPVQMKEYKYIDDYSSQNAEALNLRNNQMKVYGRGITSRQYRPDYLSIIHTGKKPLLSQENDYELHNGNWRIRKKINYLYESKSAAGIYTGRNQVRQLMIRDFVKLNEPFSGSSGDISNIYNVIGIDSFFDYNFYTLDFEGKALTGKDIVDYNYNN